MELTIENIKSLLYMLDNSINPDSSLSQKLIDEVKRLEKKQEREEKEIRYAEIIINELQKKYPEQLKEVAYYRDGDFGLVVTIEDHELYYSKEFTEFIGLLDAQYLFPNEVWIAFVTKY